MEKSRDTNITSWSSVSREVIETFGDQGDFARQHLLNPAIFSLLGNVVGKTILDAGCGTGYLARLLAKRKAVVVGLEPATPFITYVKEIEADEPLHITYIQADLTVWNDSSRVFDVVIANMVLMDILHFEKALDTCFSHLCKGGQFIFSISHPCFEASDVDYKEEGFIAVKEYLKPYIIEQTFGKRYHRPLNVYLNAVTSRGGEIKTVIEPKLSETLAQDFPEQERAVHVPAFIIFDVYKS